MGKHQTLLLYMMELNHDAHIKPVQGYHTGTIRPVGNTGTTTSRTLPVWSDRVPVPYSQGTLPPPP